jgi:hypothetical protein
MATDEKIDGPVVRGLVLLVEITGRQFPAFAVVGDAVAALAPPLAGVGTIAVLPVGILRAFHISLLALYR